MLELCHFIKIHLPLSLMLNNAYLKKGLGKQENVKGVVK